ncbi:MAG TPA: hypothetical protein VKB71_18620 [Rhizomicrobium sp.]|nr:hypothetical protein [Rhizomicrobium sp.]
MRFSYAEFDRERIGSMRRHAAEARRVTSKAVEVLAYARAALDVADALLMGPAPARKQP